MGLCSMRMAYCFWLMCSCMGAATENSPSYPSTSDDVQGRKGRQHGADVDVRQGVLFQTNGCPQAITSEAAQNITANASSTDNTVTLTSFAGGRTGNRFEGVSQTFSMAYCCRSSLLVLPAYDREMPTENGSEWISKHRWYDFSEAEMDLLPEFADLYDRPDVCLPKRNDTGQESYNLENVHPDLQRCMNRVYVRGCEAAFLGSVVNTTTPFCPSKGDQSKTRSTDNHHHRRLRDSKPEKPVLHTPTITLDGNPHLSGTGGSEGDGSLVIHIRSGDIFNPVGQGEKRPGFGQPPLQFFLGAIASKPWSDVSILTYSRHARETNPTYNALGLLNDMGLLGPNVVLHHNRPLLEDLRAMLCADALAVARSSLHFLTFAHTRASTLYLPSSCGPGQYMRQSRVLNDGLPKRCPDNATLLVLEKPGTEVYGIEWKTSRESYSPYHAWEDTDAQLLEMVLFDGVEGLKRCSITD